MAIPSSVGILTVFQQPKARLRNAASPEEPRHLKAKFLLSFVRPLITKCLQVLPPGMLDKASLSHKGLPRPICDRWRCHHNCLRAFDTCPSRAGSRPSPRLEGRSSSGSAPPPPRRILRDESPLTCHQSKGTTHDGRRRKRGRRCLR